MMTNGYLEGQIFLPHPHKNDRFFSCSPLSTAFYTGKHEKRFQKILNSLRCAMVMHSYITMTSQIDVWPVRAADMRLFVFYLSHWLVRLYVIELSHMGIKHRKSRSGVREYLVIFARKNTIRDHHSLYCHYLVLQTIGFYLLDLSIYQVNMTRLCHNHRSPFNIYFLYLVLLNYYFLFIGTTRGFNM